MWDFAEANPLAPAGTTIRGYRGVSNVASGFLAWFHIESASVAEHHIAKSQVLCQERNWKHPVEEAVDIILTDPPYYDARSRTQTYYGFFLRLAASLQSLELIPFAANLLSLSRIRLAPNGTHDARDGELIDDASQVWR